MAHSGSEAFEAAKELRPDVGVFDIGMPGVNGYELLTKPIDPDQLEGLFENAAG